MKIHYKLHRGMRYYFPDDFPMTLNPGICTGAAENLLGTPLPGYMTVYITKTKPRRRPAVRVTGDITDVWVHGQESVRFSGGRFGMFLDEEFNQRAYLTAMAEDGMILFPKEQA